MKNMADARSKAVGDLVAKKGTIADDNKFFKVKDGAKKALPTGGPLKAAPKAGGKLRAQYMKKKLKAKAKMSIKKKMAKKVIDKDRDNK